METGSSIPNLRVMRSVLETSDDVAFALDPDLRLLYRNPAWDKFALANGAPELTNSAVIGTNLQQVIPKELLPFYTAAFEKVRTNLAAWECLYECSSPQVFRKFRMQIHLLAPSGFLVRNSLLIERPHQLSAPTGHDEYVNADSLIKVCMHCRCSQTATLPHRWNFVPAFLERQLTNISHSLCPFCLEYFYPKEKDHSRSS